MRKTGLFILAIVAFTIVSARNAQAQGFELKVTVGNSSQTCAWVTIYTSRVLLPWSAYQARFVKAGGHYTWSIPFTQLGPTPIPAEIKVRAEFMKDVNCNHPVVADTSAENKGILPDQAFGRVGQVGSNLSGPPYRVGVPKGSR